MVARPASRYIDAIVGRREGVAIATARFVPGIRTLVRGRPRSVARSVLLLDACAAAGWVPFVMAYGAAFISLVFGEDSLSLGA